MKIADAKVSVIIPTFNCGRFIGEAIQSALAQTLTPAEILVIDDGSTDDTETIVRGFSCDTIKYFRLSNGGVSRARNHGLTLANGNFIAFLDADDRWAPEMLLTQIKLLNRNPRAVFSFTNFHRFDDNTGNILGDQFSYYPEIKNSEKISIDGNTGTITTNAFETLVGFGEFPAYVQCITFRAETLKNIRFNETLKFCEDAEFVLRAALLGEVQFTCLALADVRRHDTNATKDFSLLNLNKLQALQALEMEDLPKSQRSALNDRIVRAHIDSAIAFINKNKQKSGLAIAAKAMMYPGSYRRKIKGYLRIVLIMTQKILHQFNGRANPEGMIS